MDLVRNSIVIRVILPIMLIALLAGCSAADEVIATDSTNAYDKQAALAANFRTITDNYAVAAQIKVTDLQIIADAGFTRVINHRPDGEGTYQPATADLKAEAARLGLNFVDLPFRGGQLNSETFDAFSAELAASNEPTLAYCRSGTRAITIWSMAQVKAGNLTAKQAVELAKKHGYRLGGQTKMLEKLQNENQ